MSEYVYICFASTGEYSDRYELALHGYKSEEDAKAFVERSDAMFRERWAKVRAASVYNQGEYLEKRKQFAPGWLPECPDLGVPDYTGYSFWYETVEVKG